MIGFEPSLFIDEPSKTYTLSWHDSYRCTKNHLCRCRFDRSSKFWIKTYLSAIESFAWLLTLCPIRVMGCRFESPDFRLVKAGKLVARAATYQGV